MRLTIVGDPHFKNDNLDLQRKLFDKIESLANPVVILGDLLHSKEIIRGNSLNELVGLLRKSKLPFFILVGNHDLFNLNSKEHSLEALKLIPNVRIFDSSSMIEVDGQKLHFIPYIHSIEAFRAELDKVKTPKESILFLHAAVNDFDYGNGFMEKHGINIEELSKFKLVISGHFHKYAKKENLTYLGTPFSHDFGESDQKKYIGILSTKSLKMKLINTELPEHVTFVVEEEKDLEKLKQIDYKNFNRIILAGYADELSRIDLGEYLEKKVIVIERYKPRTNQEIKPLNFEDCLSSFETWAKEVKKLDSDFIESGLEILKCLKQ